MTQIFSILEESKEDILNVVNTIFKKITHFTYADAHIQYIGIKVFWKRPTIFDMVHYAAKCNYT